MAVTLTFFGLGVLAVLWTALVLLTGLSTGQAAAVAVLGSAVSVVLLILAFAGFDLVLKAQRTR